ncbi:MAG: hypothetical protein ACFFA8_00035 [Promethearchaeota archaeon]
MIRFEILFLFLNNIFGLIPTYLTIFADCGFEIYKKIEVPPIKVSSRKWLSKVPKYILEELKSRTKTRETWILQACN